MGFAVPTHKSNRPLVMGANHVVAAGHYLSALAGLAMLDAGGNAVDAGVAAGIATGVLEGTHVSVAGVAPIIIRMAETGAVETISGLAAGRPPPRPSISSATTVAKFPWALAAR